MFVGGPTPTSHPLYPAIWNLGHILFFLLFTVWLLLAVPFFQQSRNLGKFFLLSVAVFGGGMTIETIQNGLGRSPEWHDIWRNQLGVLVGWFWLAPRSPKRTIWLLGIAAAFIIELVFIGQVYLQFQAVQEQLPILSALEQDSDIERWSGSVSLSSDVAFQGSHSLRLNLSTNKYSGAALKKFPRDWRGYHWLKFAVYNPDSQPLLHNLRINDRKHDQGGYKYTDRYNRVLTLHSGWQEVTIPLPEVQSAPRNREMDMSDIFGLGLFVMELPEARTIFLDYFRLEHDGPTD